MFKYLFQNVFKTKLTTILFLFGFFILLNNVIWIILSGGRWFEPVPDGGVKPEYWNDLNRVFGGAYMLFYYTVQTNLILGAAFILLALFFSSKKVNSFFVAANTLITITFIVYWAAIAPLSELYQWKSIYYQFFNITVHFINPLLGFITLIVIRKKLLIDKRVIGISCLYIPTYMIGHAIFYGCGAITDSSNGVQGAVVYSFLDLQKIFFINLKDMPALAWFLYIALIICSPFLGVVIAWCWVKTCKIQCINNLNSYYKWMQKIKQKFYVIA